MSDSKTRFIARVEERFNVLAEKRGKDYALRLLEESFSTILLERVKQNVESKDVAEALTDIRKSMGEKVN